MDSDNLASKIKEKAKDIASMAQSIDITKLRDIINIKSTVPDINENIARIKEKATTAIINKGSKIRSAISDKIPREPISSAISQLKTQIIKKPVSPKIPAISQYNIYSIVKRLFNDVEDLKSWRKGEADPNFVNIFNNIENVILPKIINASNVAQTAQEKASEVYNLAQGAIEGATKAADYAKSILLKLQLAAESLDFSVKDIALASNELNASITGELYNIGEAFAEYGNKLKIGAENMGTKALKLGSEFIDTFYEIAIPLKYCVDEARDASEEIDDAKKYIDSWDVVKFAENIYKATNSMKNSLSVLIFEGYGGQSSVLGEINEGIYSIGSKGKDFANATISFGAIIRNDTARLYERVYGSIIAIKRDVTLFTTRFANAFQDLMNIFGKNYTDEEIAKEWERRRAERTKYLSFKQDLVNYEKSIPECHEAQRKTEDLNDKLMIEENNHNELITQWDAKIAPLAEENKYWQDKYTYVVTSFVTKVFPAHPVELINALRNYKKYSTKGAYYYDHRPDLIGKNPCAVAPNDAYCSGTFVYGNGHAAYLNYYLSVYHDIIYYKSIEVYNKYQDGLKAKKEALTIHQKLIDDIKNEIYIATQNAKKECDDIKIEKQSFIDKYGMTPEEGDKLSYEQIINL